MASPLAAKKAASAAVLSKPQMAVAQAMADGMSGAQVARKIAKGNPQKAKLWRKKIRAWSTNPHFQKAVFDLQRGEVVMGLGPAMKGLSNRAARGRVDAVKLMLAVSGMHNDRVDHSHSGEIQINVSIPRPKPTEDNIPGPGIEEGFVDADVVED
jgi:hypothetical protein